jgi:hypothetical protein
MLISDLAYSMLRVLFPSPVATKDFALVIDLGVFLAAGVDWFYR